MLQFFLKFISINCVGGTMPDAGINAIPNYRELQKARNNSAANQAPIQLQEG